MMSRLELQWRTPNGWLVSVAAVALFGWAYDATRPGSEDFVDVPATSSFALAGRTPSPFDLPLVELTSGRTQEAGSSIRLSQFLDRPIVLNVWATWCPPCLSELPVLSQAARTHPDVQFLGVVFKDTDGNVRRAFREIGAPAFPILQSAGSTFPSDYEISGVPVTIFIDQSGLITRIVNGELSADLLKEVISVDFGL